MNAEKRESEEINTGRLAGIISYPASSDLRESAFIRG
jgi:hypothetical protein